MRVLERNARGVSLTPAGEVLVRHASALLDAARRAEEAVRDAAGIGRAQVRVAAFPSAAAGLLPGATRELRGAPARRRADAAGARGRAGARRAAGRPRRRRRDRAVAARRPRSSAPGVDYLPICDDEMRIAVAADHPLATRTSIALEELCDEPCLVTEVARHVRGLQRRPATRSATRASSRTCASSPTTTRRCRAWRRPGSAWRMIPTMALDELPHATSSCCRCAARAPARQILAAVRTGEQDPLVEHMVESLRAPPRALAGVPTLVGRGLALCLAQVGGDLVRGAVAVDLDQHALAVVVDQRLACPRRTRAAAPRSRRRVSSARPRASRRCSTTSSGTSRKTTASKSTPVGLRERAREAVEHVAVAGLEDRADGLR